LHTVRVHYSPARGTDRVYRRRPGGVVQLARWGLLDEVLASGAPAVRRIVFRTGDDELVRQATGPGWALVFAITAEMARFPAAEQFVALLRRLSRPGRPARQPIIATTPTTRRC
jgi:hypothetical protein